MNWQIVEFVLCGFFLLAVGGVVGGASLFWGKPITSIWFFELRYGKNFWLADEPIYCWRDSSDEYHLVCLRPRYAGHPWPWPTELIVNKVDVPTGYRGEVFVGRDATGRVFVQSGTFEK